MSRPSYRTAKADKQLQDKLQALLSHLLREEDNKYCADCDAKGPRWASWNLGIFVCIRCAGIHRNLGVHISRVKSVNLDSWTDEQVGSMQNMGNSKGRAVYEANLPDGFRRPQNDSALETFIRAKYEHKKYIAREWVPPKNAQKADFSVLGGPAPSNKPSEKKLELNPKSTLVPRPNSSGNLKDIVSPTPPTPQQSSTTTSPSSPSDDLFADFISAPPVATPASTVANNASSEEQDFFNQVSSGPVAPTQSSSGAKIDKESILSLYAKAPPVQSTMQLPSQNHMLAGGPVNPQMANNPFLMGGIVAPQAPFGGMPAFPAQQNFGFPQQNTMAANSFQQPPPANLNLMNSQFSNLQLNAGAQKPTGNGTLTNNLWN